MSEVVVWVLGIYGVVFIIFNLWDLIRKKRKWILILLADDPRRIEGEIRSILFDLPAKNLYLERLIVLWQNTDYKLAQKISEEFPEIEVVEMVGEASLTDIIGDKRSNNILY